MQSTVRSLTATADEGGGPRTRINDGDIEKDREELLEFMRENITPEIQEMIEMALAIEPSAPRVEIVVSTEGTTNASEE